MQVIADSDNAATRALQDCVEARQIVQQIVTCALDEVVDLVQNDDVNSASAVHSLDEVFEDSIGRPTCEWYRHISTLSQATRQSLHYSIARVDLSTIDFVRAHGLPKFSPLLAQLAENESGYHSLATSRDTVE